MSIWKRITEKLSGIQDMPIIYGTKRFIQASYDLWHHHKPKRNKFIVSAFVLTAVMGGVLPILAPDLFEFIEETLRIIIETLGQTFLRTAGSIFVLTWLGTLSAKYAMRAWNWHFHQQTSEFNIVSDTQAETLSKKFGRSSKDIREAITFLVEQRHKSKADPEFPIKPGYFKNAQSQLIKNQNPFLYNNTQQLLAFLNPQQPAAPFLQAVPESLVEQNRVNIKIEKESSKTLSR